MNTLIALLTTVLILTSLFLVMVVLMQRAKSDAGMGSAMGGSSMESTFGAETGNVLTNATKWAAIVFFSVSFCLYLAHVYQAKHQDTADSALPLVAAPASAVPASAAPASAPQPLTPPPAAPKKP